MDILQHEYQYASRESFEWLTRHMQQEIDAGRYNNKPSPL